MRSRPERFVCNGEHQCSVIRGLSMALGVGTASAAFTAFPQIGVVALGITVVVIAGIFLPAIWSRSPDRRRDARLLAFRILRLLERRR